MSGKVSFSQINNGKEMRRIRPKEGGEDSPLPYTANSSSILLLDWNHSYRHWPLAHQLQRALWNLCFMWLPNAFRYCYPLPPSWNSLLSWLLGQTLRDHFLPALPLWTFLPPIILTYFFSFFLLLRYTISLSHMHRLFVMFCSPNSYL